MSHYYIVKAVSRAYDIRYYVPKSGGYSKCNLTVHRSDAKHMSCSGAYWCASQMVNSGQFPEEHWRIVVVRVRVKERRCRTCKRPL